MVLPPCAGVCEKVRAGCEASPRCLCGSLLLRSAYAELPFDRLLIIHIAQRIHHSNIATQCLVDFCGRRIYLLNHWTVAAVQWRDKNGLIAVL